MINTNRMNMYPILLLTACLTAGCGGAGGGGSESAAEGTTPAGTDERKPTATVYNETRTVSLNDPYMQNAQVLTIECLPGWQLVGKVDMEDFQQANGTPNIQIKGSDGARQLGFYTETTRSYYDENDGVATGAAQHEAAIYHRRRLPAIRGKDAVSPCTVHRTEGGADLRQTAGRDETTR